MTISVTSIARVEREPNKKGTKHLAYCTIKVGELLTLEGCLLVDHPQFGRVIWAPSFANQPNNWKQGVKLGDGLRKACADAASAAYDALASNDNQTSPAISAAVELVRQVEQRDAA
jgi:hypothetical protein